MVPVVTVISWAAECQTTREYFTLAGDLGIVGRRDDGLRRGHFDEFIRSQYLHVRGHGHGSAWRIGLAHTALRQPLNYTVEQSGGTHKESRTLRKSCLVRERRLSRSIFRDGQTRRTCISPPPLLICHNCHHITHLHIAPSEGEGQKIN